MIRGACWAQRRRQAGWFLRRFSRVAKSGTAGSFGWVDFLFGPFYLRMRRHCKLYEKCTPWPGFAKRGYGAHEKAGPLREIAGGWHGWHILCMTSDTDSCPFGKFCWINSSWPARKKNKSPMPAAMYPARNGICGPLPRQPCNPNNQGPMQVPATRIRNIHLQPQILRRHARPAARMS